MRTFVHVMLVVCVASCGVARAAELEVIEVPLPEVTGDYTLSSKKPFSIDLGFPLGRIEKVSFRAEGSAIAPLAYDDNSGRLQGPAFAYFAMALQRDDGRPPGWTAYGPHLGKATHPQPESFAAEVDFPDGDWAFLADGIVNGELRLSRPVSEPEIHFVGGGGTITAASLIITTSVPEPGLLSLSALVIWRMQCRRRR